MWFGTAENRDGKDIINVLYYNLVLTGKEEYDMKKTLVNTFYAVGKTGKEVVAGI